MRGHEDIVAARLAGHRVDRIEIERLATKDMPEPALGVPMAGLHRHGGEIVGLVLVLPTDSAAQLDLRCCYGMSVLVLAGSYADGWSIAERVIEVEPASMRFAAPEFAARYENGRLDAWEL